MRLPALCPLRRLLAAAICYALVVIAYCPAAQAGAAQYLEWSDRDGVIWTTLSDIVDVDGGGEQHGPSLLFVRDKQAIAMDKPVVTQDGPDKLELTYSAETPDGGKLEIRRRLECSFADDAYDLVETFELRPASPIHQDLEIDRPFTINSRDSSETAGETNCVLALKNGWVRPQPLTADPVIAEYRLGHWLGGKKSTELALPVMQAERAGQWQAAICADPRYSAQFTVQQTSKAVGGEVRYTYLASRVPIGDVETRSFGFSLRKSPPANEPFGKSLDAFFRLMLPDVPPGAQWLHGIYMVDYDYLSDGGEGWDRDVAKLAEWLTPEERSHVALCFHGWYDYLGSYSYDDSTGKMKDKWIAMPGSRKVPYTREKMQQQLRHARELGFHVLLYFGDGPNQDSGAPNFHPEWSLVNKKGESIRETWVGPDTVGQTYIRNPSIPEVAKWYQNYLRALINDYGSVLDGFVWDETSYVREGDISEAPTASYCARGMFDLVKSLTAQLRAYDPQKVFLTSDCVGFPGMEDAVGYAMVADGNFQDTWCLPQAWSPMLLANWRNTSWSCIWAAQTNYHWMKWGVDNFGTPVSISNGFGDDQGPSEWTPGHRDEVLRLFHKRMAAGPEHVRFVTEDPVKFVAEHGPDVVHSDPIPDPLPGETNWALASSGSHAMASSEINGANAQYPASGAIDGERGPAGWDNGHGWASDGSALPQWLEVDFPKPQSVSRFIITTFNAPGESAVKHGVVNYTIEVWDETSKKWKAVVNEDKDRLLVTRVHVLPAAISASKFRVVVTQVMPGAGGIARLLQVEAWGNASKS